MQRPGIRLAQSAAVVSAPAPKPPPQPQQQPPGPSNAEVPPKGPSISQSIAVTGPKVTFQEPGQPVVSTAQRPSIAQQELPGQINFPDDAVPVALPARPPTAGLPRPPTAKAQIPAATATTVAPPARPPTAAAGSLQQQQQQQQQQSIPRPPTAKTTSSITILAGQTGTQQAQPRPQTGKAPAGAVPAARQPGQVTFQDDIPTVELIEEAPAARPPTAGPPRPPTAKTTTPVTILAGTAAATTAPPVAGAQQAPTRPQTGKSPVTTVTAPPSAVPSVAPPGKPSVPAAGTQQAPATRPQTGKSTVVTAAPSVAPPGSKTSGPVGTTAPATGTTVAPTGKPAPTAAAQPRPSIGQVGVSAASPLTKPTTAQQKGRPLAGAGLGSGPTSVTTTTVTPSVAASAAPKITISPSPKAAQPPKMATVSPTQSREASPVRGDEPMRSRLSSNDRSIGFVAPISPSSSQGHSPFDFSTYDPSIFPIDPSNSNYLQPAAAALLAKFKPYNEKADKALRARIAARRKGDQDKLQRQALEEAKLVDGQLIVDDDEDQLENDPKLAEGKSLPKAVAHHFPKHMLGIPIEDVDPRNREYEETFLVVSRRFNRLGYIYRFSASPSCFLFKPWNPIRKLAIYAYTHPLFDIVVIATILLNSVFMAMNVDEQVPEYTFLAVYTLEAIVKAISRGVILSQHTYLRDPWNWLDFFVLVTAYVMVIIEYASAGSNIGASLSGLKALRVFRVLKTVALIPGLKTIIEALLRALRMLGDVLIMTVLFFTVFALFGVQIFQGTLQSKCVLNADAVDVVLNYNGSNFTGGVNYNDWVYNQSNWFMQDDQWEFMVCGNTSMAQQCPYNYTCLSLDGTPNPNNDFTKFDNFFSSFMIAIQLFNTDYWDFLYHAVIAANGPAAFLFFVIAIMFLNFYLANLVQAVVALSYQVEEDDDDEDAPEVVVAARKNATARRFVFDPTRLRLVLVGPDAISRSMMSIKNVTERKFNIVKANTPAPPDESSDHNNAHNNGKPVAVVRPQVSSAASSNARTIDQHYHQHQEHDLEKSLWPAFENTKLYRTSSRPPSAVSIDDLPKIGFWDRNPGCCLKCCMGFFPWLKVQSWIHVIVTDPFFELFITLSIVINTVSMAANYYMIPDDVGAVLDNINNACTYIFITECVLKLLALCGEYFENRWNWLDFIVVIGSLVDIITSNINIGSGGFNTSIIRLLRLLRILKLAQSWKTMRTLLEIIFGTFSEILNLLIVLVIVMFVFAVIGMQVFGTTYTIDKFPGFPGAQTFTPFPGFTGVPEWNFNDFFHAFMIVFRILCRETYQPMFDCITANSAATCIPFFLVTLLIGSYVVLNLFLAVLLNAFNADEMKKIAKDEEESKLTKRMRAIRHFFRDIFAKCRHKLSSTGPMGLHSVATEMSLAGNRSVGDDNDGATTVAPDDFEDRDEQDTKPVKAVKLNIPNDIGEENDSPTPKKYSDLGSTTKTTATTTRKTRSGTGTARSTDSQQETKVKDCCWPVFDRRMPWLFKAFAPDAPIGSRFLKARLVCNDICTHKAFEYSVLAFIFLSSLSLCLQDANLEDDSNMGLALGYLDYTFQAAFTIELIIKLFAQGFRTYFTTSWTLLDFFIVSTGYADIIVSEFANGVNLSALRALRCLRALRPLRAISRWQGMKIVINALMTAIPGIINVLLVVMIIWLIFAIMGVSFFSGKFWMCVDRVSGNRTASQLVPNRKACELRPNDWQWSYYFVNFDNVANAYLALFQMGSFEGWTAVYQMSVDAPENIGDQPAPELNIYYYVYYIIFIVLCSFFLLNLFVGVIIDDFNALKKKYEGGTALTLFMTDSQKKYYTTISKLGQKKPRKTIVKPTNVVGLFFFEISGSTRFEFAIAFVIAANVICMATEHFRQEPAYTVAQELMNFIFTVVFALEALFKLFGFRLHYFQTAWNVFDFAIVLLSIMSILLQEFLTSLAISPSLLRILRVLRVGRILRLIRASKGVRKLMLSLMMSLPALFNIGSLLFLIIFIFAIIGMNLFGHVGHYGGNLDDLVNFHTFPNALLTLFRLTTISGWDNVHQGLSFTDDPTTGCNPNVNLLDPNYPKNNPCCNRTAWVRPNGQLVVDGSGNCGNYTLASFFVVIYLLFTYFIVVNMFAAVILDNYQQATQQEDIGVTDDDIERFYTIWEQYDPLATQFIKYQDLSNFVAALDPPLCCPKPNEHTLTLLDMPILQDNKSGEEIIHCLDVLMGLVRKALGSIDDTEDFSQVRENLENVFKKTFPNRVQVQKVCTTKLRKKQDVAAKTLQRAYRNWKASRGLRDAARARGNSVSAYAVASRPSAPPAAAAGQQQPRSNLLAVPQLRKP